jgi:hypothetical protein
VKEKRSLGDNNYKEQNQSSQLRWFTREAREVLDGFGQLFEAGFPKGACKTSQTFQLYYCDRRPASV